MKKLLLLMLFCYPIYSNEFDWVTKELSSLQQKYKEYLKKAPEIKKPSELTDLECSLMMYSPTSSVLTFESGDIATLPQFEFFIYANPLNPSHATMTLSNKIRFVETDLAKLDIFLFLIPKFARLYHGNKNNKDYARFLYDIETEMLSLAKKSLSAKEPEKEMLSLTYGLFINELSKINFPPIFSFYRRRILISIDTPEGARDEIIRLSKHLKELQVQQ
ncbi:MAG: hypothetical protein ACRCVW_05345 [Brevinema sp.]